MAPLFGKLGSMKGGNKAADAGSKKMGMGKPSKSMKAAPKKPQKKFGRGGGGGEGASRTKSGLFVPSPKSSVFAQPDGDALWYPYATRPSWLDGGMPGDVGFDPFELSAPKKYLQISVDEQNVTGRKSVAGTLQGEFKSKGKAPTSDFNPYAEIFDIDRFRECEVMHGRWAMMALLGIVIAENQTGVSWVDAGKVELAQAQYANRDLPFTVGQLTGIEVLLMGGVEFLRNTERDVQKRCYPGGNFDPLGLASSDPETTFNLKTAEVKHARLAMLGMLWVGIKGLATGNGAFINPNGPGGIPQTAFEAANM